MYCWFCSTVPEYAKIQGNTTLTVSTDPITGRSDVTYTYNVTSHWSSLAVVKSVYGQLTKELTTDDTVVDALSLFSPFPTSGACTFRVGSGRRVGSGKRYPNTCWTCSFRKSSLITDVHCMSVHCVSSSLSSA